MRAIELAGFGGPEVLRLTQRPVPEPGAGELLIAVAASGINRPDVLQRKGLYPPPPGATDIPGLEVAGTVVDGDPAALQAHGLKRGDAVCALVAGGGYAQYCVVPAGQCLPVPAGWSMVEAASIPETLFTVWSNLVDRAGLRAGQSILIHGGSSGIGVMAIQLARALGASAVWVTVGSPAKAEACVALGADAAIDYRRQDFVEEVQRLSAGRGVDVVLDMVAGDYLNRNLRILAEDGCCVLIAVQGGARAEIDAGLVLRRRLTLTGSTLRPRSVAFKTAIAQQLRQRVWPLLESRQIRPVVHATFQPEACAQAHRTMEQGQHIGKLVIQWN